MLNSLMYWGGYDFFPNCANKQQYNILPGWVGPSAASPPVVAWVCPPDSWALLWPGGWWPLAHAAPSPSVVADSVDVIPGIKKNCSQYHCYSVLGYASEVFLSQIMFFFLISFSRISSQSCPYHSPSNYLKTWQYKCIKFYSVGRKCVMFL